MNETKKMILASLFAALTAVGAFIRIPLPYVPIVLQGLFVLLAGIVLGSKWGAISQLAYVTIGLAGVPVFTAGGGIGYVLNPTFGYLLGFIIAAYVVGKIMEKTELRDFKTVLSACFAGTFIIYIIGVPYLAVILKLIAGRNDAVKYAFMTGFLTALPGDIIKAFLAAFISQKLPFCLFQKIRKYQR